VNGTVHDLWTLTRLRYKLLVRSALNRYTRGARRAAPFRFLLALFIGVWILTALVVPADFLLTTALHGDQGRRDLTSVSSPHLPLPTIHSLVSSLVPVSL